MKKMIAMILCLVMIAALTGCKTKENESAVVGGDTCPAICIDEVFYYDTGRAMPVEPDPSVIEYVEMPLGNSTNEKASAWAKIEDDKLAVLIGDEWYEFVAK